VSHNPNIASTRTQAPCPASAARRNSAWVLAVEMPSNALIAPHRIAGLAAQLRGSVPQRRRRHLARIQSGTLGIAFIESVYH